MVLRSTDHTLPQQKPLEAVRAEVVAAWKKQRGVELASGSAADAVKRLNAGESWDAVAKSLGRSVQAPKFVRVPIRTCLWKFAPTPSKRLNLRKKPTYENVRLPNGDAAVFAFSAVREDPNDVRAQGRGHAPPIRGSHGLGRSAKLCRAARADATVTVNPQAID